MEPIWTLPPLIVHDLSVNAMAGLPWHVSDYGIDKKIWPKISHPVVVGNVDTGVSKRHVERGELDGLVLDAKDFTNSDYGYWDRQGHGSHTAGIIAARSFGIARGAVKLVSAKALDDDSGSGTDAQIAGALQYCADKGAKLINMSLGSSMRSARIMGVISELAEQGVLCVCAAGNDGGDVNWPGKSELVLAVSAIDRARRLAKFSCRGDAIDVTAPGVEITSLAPGSGYAVMSGTSMACPWITGYLAAMISLYTAAGLTPPTDAKSMLPWLIEHSTDLGRAGLDPEFGAGLPDPDKFAVPTQPPVPGDIGLPLTPDTGKPAEVIVKDQFGRSWRSTDWALVK